MLAPRIALRYIFSKKSHNAVGVISTISVAGVAVATAAIVIVLSVFNGFTHVAASRLSDIYPDLKVVPSQGKAFANGDSLAYALASLPQVAAALPVVQDQGLAISGAEQMPIVFKGVPPQYVDASGLSNLLVDGEFYPQGYDGERPGALTSVGVAMGINARPGAPIDIYAPKRQGRINPAAPQMAFRASKLMATGVYQIDMQEYDKDLVIIPLDQARMILGYGSQATAIEVTLRPRASVAQAAAEINKMLGPQGRALDKTQQQHSAFRMIMVEKWVTFLMLAFILVIASFNIISTLSLMVIEKRANMDVMRAMGASAGFARRVFVWQGWFITLAGGVAGIALGVALSLAQQWGGFIKLAGDASQLAIKAYPVRVLPADLLIVLALVCAVALCASMATMAIARPSQDIKISTV